MHLSHIQDKIPYEDLKFGKSFSDHMLEIDWDAVNGWHDPKITPYHYFSLSPAATALHYGIEVGIHILYTTMLV